MNTHNALELSLLILVTADSGSVLFGGSFCFSFAVDINVMALVIDNAAHAVVGVDDTLRVVEWRLLALMRIV